MATRYSSLLTCTYHPGAALVEDYRAGDMICSECGLVVGDRVIDVGTEWRTFSNDKDTKDNSRVGAAENPLFEGQNLGTNISMPSGSDGYDEFGNPKYRNRKNYTGAERAMMTAFRDISQMADRLNLPRTICDKAERCFKQVYESKALRGRHQVSVVAACLYIACRQENVPRSFKEICAVSGTSKKDVGRCFKLIVKTIEANPDLIAPADLIPRICSNLGLAREVQKVAVHIARKAVEMDLAAGRSPTSIAAASVYMACLAADTKTTGVEIGETAGVAEATIKQTYKDMHKSMPQLFPADYTPVVPFTKLPGS